MARTQQDILVKIKVLFEGLGNVRAFAGHIKEINTGGGGGKTAALAGDIDKLSAAVNRLSASQEKASSKGGFVRFLVGVSAVVNTLGSIPQALKGVEKLLDFFDHVGGGVGKAAGKVKEFGSSLFSSLSQFAAGVGAQAGAVVEGLGGAVSGLGAALAAALPIILAVGAAVAVLIGTFAAAAIGVVGLAAAVGVGSVALTKIAQVGLEVHRQLEQVQLGIAAVITSLAGMKVDGVPVEGAEKFRLSMGLAADQLKKLQVDAVNTVATFGQIAPAFQSAIAPGLAAGLTLDQIRGITVKVVQAASAIGLPLEQVNQEVRAILEGTINEDARLAKVLGISNKMVASWKAQGKLADELNKRLEGFAVAGEEAAGTLDGLISNLQEALNVFSGEATTRAFEALKAEFRKLLPQLFDFKSAGLQEQFKSLASLADEVLVRLVRAGGVIVGQIVSGLRRAAQFVEQNRGLIDDILDISGRILRQVGSIISVFGDLATDTYVWRGALQAVHGLLTLISLVLDPILQKLREAAPLLRIAAIAATAFVVSNPAFGALGGGRPGGGGAPAGPSVFDQFRGLDPNRRNIELTGPKLAGGGGGKKGGGGGRKSKIPELTRELGRANIDAELAEAQEKFAAVKQDIQASIEGIRNGLDDALVSITDAYRLEAELADKALAAEKVRIDAELKAAKDRRDLAVKALDPDLKPAERRLAIAAEDRKLAAETTRLEGERKRLVEETADKKAGLVNDEAKANREMQRALADIEGQLDSMSRSSSVRADAAAREIEARFEETRRQLVANFGEASEEVKALDRLIRQLTERANFHELTSNVERKFGELRDLEELLSVGVETGQIRAREATRRRLELEREYRRTLLDEINGLAEIARRTGDPELLAAVRKLQIEWAKLGKDINETAKRLDDTLRSGLEDTLTSIITRTETVGDAFRKLAQTILAEIARILAVNFVEKLFGGILNTNTRGTSLGGILAGILGAGTPKTSGTPARPGSGIENIPLIIKNFASGTFSGLRGVNESTKGVSDSTERGFGQVNSNFGTAIGILGNLVSFQAAQAAAAVATAATTIFKVISAGSGPHAEGGPIHGPGTGTSDSILARLSNGEFVLREWATRRIGLPVLEYMNRMGVVPDGPRFALGGAVGMVADINPPDSVGGDTFNVKVEANFSSANPQAFKQNEAQFTRDLARLAQRGMSRAASRLRG